MTIAIAGLAVGVAGLVTGGVAYSRATRLREEFDAVRREARAARAAPTDPRAIRSIAMVRYDAFQDMGGTMSFSAALLDSFGDGIVLTTINGRTEARTYAKIVRGDTATQPLSPEEEQAVRNARDGRGALAASSPDGSGVSVRHA